MGRTPKKTNSNRSDIEKDLYRLYLKEVIAIPMLTREEELNLAYQSQKGDTEALRKLVESNLRFVVKIARKFQRPDISILDLINEGNIGLIEGVRRFDPDKNVRLLSYAVWWIKQTIHYYITHQGRMIPLGSKITSVQCNLRNISKSENTETEHLNREMMCRKLGISTKVLEYALQLSAKILSLDTRLNEEEGPVLGENIPQKLMPSPDQLVIAKERNQYVKTLMSHLSDIEATVLQMRFGIGGNNRMTLREIGNIFGLTRERIRQIQNQSIAKLRPIVKNENVLHYYY